MLRSSKLCSHRGGDRVLISFFISITCFSLSAYILYRRNHIHSTHTTANPHSTFSSKELFDSYDVQDSNPRRNIRLLCWVATTATTVYKRAKYVKMTWGKRCDVLLFFGSFSDTTFPVIKLDVEEGRAHLAEKTQAAFSYIYNKHRHDADWFLKADDDTFVLVDNLKHYLKDFDTLDPLYFGFRFNAFTPQGFNSGGAGYVLSQKSLFKYITEGVGNKCNVTHSVEDRHMGECMYKLGVRNVNTLDKENRTRFHSYTPRIHMDHSDRFLKINSAYGERTGALNISTYPFTFHYVKGEWLRQLEFLIYHVRHVGSEGTVLT